MTQRFYFHDSTCTVPGTLPTTEHSSAYSSSVAVTGSTTPRNMDDTKGSSQVSVSFNTLANTSSQPSWIRTFVSQPLAAKVISAASLTVVISILGAESDGKSNFVFGASVQIWNPSNGTRTYMIVDASNISTAEVGTTPTALSGTQVSLPATDVTINDGDLLVCEIWRRNNAQQQANVYTNTYYYDGTTETSTTSNAGYLDVGTDLPLYSPPPPAGTFEGWGVPI